MKLTQKPSTPKVTRVSILFMWIGLFVIATVLLIVFAANALKTNGVFKPEIVLPLVVITGVIALLATLAITAATFGLFNISDKSQALGLPAGSIQAVIALSLILIFAVVSLYASGETGTEQFESTGLTRAQFASIPPQQVVAAKRVKVEGKVAYDVVRSVEDPGARDINTQLLTTVSTLVVAVAGFYFGSKSVQEGGAAALEAAGPTRSLNVLSPVSPHSMHPHERLRGVKLQTVPADAQVRWSVLGGGGLAKLEDGTFVYAPGEDMKAGDSATLHFEQVDDPKVSDTLTVTLVEGHDKREKKAAPSGGVQAPATQAAAKAKRRKARKAAARKKGQRRQQGGPKPPEAPGLA